MKNRPTQTAIYPIKPANFFSQYAVLIICFSVFILSACSTSSVKLSPLPKPTTLKPAAYASVAPYSAEQRSALCYNILLARIANSNNALEVAHGNYQEAAEKTQSQHLIKKAALIALKNHQFDDALADSEYWLTLDSHNLEAHQLAFYSALLLHNTEVALQHFSHLQQYYGDDRSAQNKKNIQAKKHTPNQNTLNVHDQLFSVMRQEHFTDNQQSSSALKQMLFTASQAAQVSLDDYVAHHYLPRIQKAIELSSNPSWRLAWLQQLLQATALVDNLDALLTLKHAIEQEFLAIEALDPAFASASMLHLSFIREDNPERFTAMANTISQADRYSNETLWFLAQYFYEHKHYGATTNLAQRLNANFAGSEGMPYNRREDIEFLLASSLFADEQYEQSSALFFKLAQNDFRQAVSSYYCGSAAYYNEDPIQAISCYEMVPVGEYFLTARRIIAKLYHDNNQSQAALNSLRSAHNIAPPTIINDLFALEASLLFQLKRYTDILQLTKSWLEFDATNEQAQSFTIVAFNQHFSKETAVEQSLEYIRHINSPVAKHALWSLLANIYSEQEDYFDAITVLDAALLDYPTDTALLNSRALTFLHNHDFIRAEKDYRQLVALEPNNAITLNELGYLLLEKTEHLEEATQLLQKAYKLEPSSPYIQDSLGWAYFKQGDYERSAMLLATSLAQAPNSEVSAHYGEVLWKLGDKQQAINVWQQALQQTPTDDYLLQTLKRYPEALEQLAPNGNSAITPEIEKRIQENLQGSGWTIEQ